MSKQQTLSMAADQGSGFARYAKPTRRDDVLAAMEALVPWLALCNVIAPHYRGPWDKCAWILAKAGIRARKQRKSHLICRNSDAF
jgi:hypothetical protein